MAALQREGMLRILKDEKLKRTLLLVLILGLLGIFSVSRADDISNAQRAAGDLANNVLNKLGNEQGINDKLIKPTMSGEIKMNTLSVTYECSTNGALFLSIDECQSNCSGSCSVYQGFNAQLQCPSTSEFLKITIIPTGTNDFRIIVSQDTDLDGNLDYTFTPTFQDTAGHTTNAASGVCKHGVVVCQPGTWDFCASYAWTVDTDGRLGFVQTASMMDVGQCWCVNNSCGGVLTGSYPQVLNYLGSGAAMVLADAKGIAISKAETNVSELSITFYGQSSAECAHITDTTYGSDGSAPEILKEAYSTGILPVDEEIAEQSTNPDSYYSQMTEVVEAMGLQSEKHVCTIDRRATIYAETRYREPAPDCTVWQCDAVPSAPGEVYRRCDFAENIYYYYVEQGSQFGMRLDCRDRCVPAGGSCWDRGCSYPDGAYPWCFATSSAGSQLECSELIAKQYHYVCCCDKEDGWDYGEHVMRYYYRQDNSVLRIDRISLNLDDACSAFESNPDCRLREEKVCDWQGQNCVYTWQNFTPIGLNPLPSCQQLSGTVDNYVICINGLNATVTDSTGDHQVASAENMWWHIERVYECQTDEMEEPDLSRAKTAIETADPASGTYQDTLYGTGHIPLDLLPTQADECEMVCVVTKITQDTTAYPDSTNKANATTSPTTREYIIKTCTRDENSNWHCPLGAGEVKYKPTNADCGCIDMFPEAATAMSVVYEASKDMICSSSPP